MSEQSLATGARHLSLTEHRHSPPTATLVREPVLESLTPDTWVAKTDPRLYRAVLLKERFEAGVPVALEEADEALKKWIGWARRGRTEAFVKLQRSVVKHRDAILTAFEHGPSNGRIESVNAKVRLITRTALGFRSSEAMIALAMLSLGGHRPTLHGGK